MRSLGTPPLWQPRCQNEAPSICATAARRTVIAASSPEAADPDRQDFVARNGEGTITRGETVGTPQYMAPEQARGGKVDVRADLYALGALAYRALTGHPPFTGDDLAAILVDLLDRMPVRPSALVPMREDLDLVLAIALAKKPRDRFQSAAELAAAFREAVGGRLHEGLRRRARALLATMPWSPPPRRASVGPPSR